MVWGGIRQWGMSQRMYIAHVTSVHTTTGTQMFTSCALNKANLYMHTSKWFCVILALAHPQGGRGDGEGEGGW